MRTLLPIVLTLALTPSLFAQHNPITGGPGTDILYGTAGPQTDLINGMGGTDQICDSPNVGRSDGVTDVLVSDDGVHDIVFAGPEDYVFPDALDLVIIRDANGDVLFNGSGRAYNFWRGLVEAIEDFYWTLNMAIDDLWDLLLDAAAQNQDDELVAAFDGAILFLISFEEAVAIDGKGELSATE